MSKWLLTLYTANGINCKTNKKLTIYPEFVHKSQRKFEVQFKRTGKHHRIGHILQRNISMSSLLGERCHTGSLVAQHGRSTYNTAVIHQNRRIVLHPLIAYEVYDSGANSVLSIWHRVGNCSLRIKDRKTKHARTLGLRVPKIKSTRQW